MTKEFNFAELLRLEGKSQRTVEEYVRRVNLWYKYLFRENDIFAATRQDVMDYQAFLLKQGQNIRTVNVKLSSLSSYYEHAIQHGLLENNPVPKGVYIKLPAPDTPRLTDDDLQLIEAWMDTLQANMRAAFWCLYGSGARVGEIAKLTKADISVIGGAIYLNIKGAKWGSDRKIPIMHAKAAKVVWKFAQEQSPSTQPLFRLSKRTIQGYAAKFGNETGLPFHCHILRHNLATRLVEKGVPLVKIQSLLGHKTPSMTMHYTKNANFNVAEYAPIDIKYKLKKGKLDNE